MKNTRETYTFSRALHMMRYGGKKMRPIDHNAYCYFVKNGELKWKDGEAWGEVYSIDSKFIMGSWMEVK